MRLKLAEEDVDLAATCGITNVDPNTIDDYYNGEKIVVKRTVATSSSQEEESRVSDSEILRKYDFDADQSTSSSGACREPETSTMDSDRDDEAISEVTRLLRRSFHSIASSDTLSGGPSLADGFTTPIVTSLGVTPLKRAASMDIDEEESETLTKKNLDHVRKWFSELQSLESVDPVPYSCNTPMAIEADTNASSGDISIQCASGGISNINNLPAASISASSDNDVRPSSSGMDKKSRRIVEVLEEGSEFDSDFDDEYNIDEFAVSAGAGRDIPEDDELNEPERNIVNTVSKAMDEAIDRQVTVSTDFVWQSNFDTFGGVPEEFSGPTPGPITDYDTPYEAFTDI
ncbi:unnamed protein product [Parnassius apollo]|uniref:(apollo) hypothetical protein n=1 Tax=Parnassius apollo TaxID=110799 RepID=A0A8S3X782_PARAO|nr:unnamed protein product [Parnassius apollo]